jgi:hypothetical protein
MNTNFNKKVAPILLELQKHVELIGVQYPSGAVSAPGGTDRQRRQWIKHRIVQEKYAVVKTSKGTFSIACVEATGNVVTHQSRELRQYLELK